MAHCEYIIVNRSGAWWLTIDGARRGPYVSKEIAIRAGIHAAKLDFREGKSARVSVEEPGEGVPVVYETGEKL
jgi:hypothetical protein